MTKNIWEKYTDKDLENLNTLVNDYKEFLQCKTERECTKEIIKKIETAGFKNLDYYLENNLQLSPNDKVYVNNIDKALALFKIGSSSITEGMNILGAHIDSPRLDLKANPLYEEEGFTYFDTHYYGGIKKYQWTTIPLALHGILIKKDGTKININIGEEANDPLFCITDLLPHLALDQMERIGRKLILGEDLNILIGSKKTTSKETPYKEYILNLLQKKYAIEEADFLSAEIEVVPAGLARDCGLDESMVIAYGQDDRVCAYTALQALLQTDAETKTLSCLFVDKEEIGSFGATSMASKFYLNALLAICQNLKETSPLALSKVLQNSKMLSCDVNAAYDPIYKDVMDKSSASYLNHGPVFCKYTGSGGKNGSNDANAEFIGELRKIMDDNNISFQISELGKVDIGGGGTIAYILANENIQVIDCGLAILNMHAPWEITSKADIYESYRAYIAFLKNA